MSTTITSVEIIRFNYTVEDIGPRPSGVGYQYAPGSTLDRDLFAVEIGTNAGVSGAYVSRTIPAVSQIEMVADYLLGENPFARERIWSELKRALRKHDRMGVGPIDIALWDFAGNYYGAPIHELLGTYRERLPTYASTYQADDNSGLDSPRAYADFAEECLERGFPAFKIHGWGGSDDQRDIAREVETVTAVGERVGDEMDLMIDPACEYETFADALKVGRACDEQGYFWYEDPYRDGGISQHGHRKLRQMLDTPLLQTEHVRGLEPHTDFVAEEATDFVRADPEWDGGITGTMKIARMAEGFGLDVEVHAIGPAKRHCAASIRNTNYYELNLLHPDVDNIIHPPVYAGDYTDELDAIDNDGTVPVPDGPGLGVEYDWSFIESHESSRTAYSI